MKRYLLALLGVLLASTSAFGQAATKSAPQTAVGGEAAPQALPWSASLLLIRADWSKSPDWKEIEADLRQVLSGEPVRKEDLAKLPASWPQILFPVSAASIYSQQHYAQILAWLKAKQLVMQIEPFVSEKVEPAVPGGEQFVNPPSLSKSYEFFGLPTPRAQSDLFFTRTTEFRWTVWERTVLRALDQYEKARGQEGIQPVDRNSFDNCNFDFTPLADGEVMIVHGFPDPTGDAEFRQAASTKGFLPLIVVERGPPSAAAAAEPRVLLPDKVERIKAQRTHGFGSGGRGGGFGVPTTATTKSSAGPPSRYITSKNIMINWSESKDVGWGFSKSLGKWAKQELNPPATDVKGLVVDEDLAVWRVGPAYYGFSGEAGRWDVLRLAEGHTPPPVLDRGIARVHDGDDVYTFAGSTGRWSSPKDSITFDQSAPNQDLEIKKREIEEQYKAAQTKLNVIEQQLTNPDLDLSTQEKARLKSEAAQLVRQIDSKNRQELGLINEPVAPSSQGDGTTRREGGTETKSDGTQIKVFSLRNVRAVDVERTVNQLFGREIHSAAADERSNTLIVRGSPDDLNVIFAILVRLDQESNNQPPLAVGATESADGGGLLTAKVYEAKEQQSAALALQVRELQSGGKGDQAKVNKLTADLRKAIAEAFAARQQLHQAELAQLQQRMSGIRQSLNTRDSLKDQIIDRRVKDLLDPNLQWEVAQRTSPPRPQAPGQPNWLAQKRVATEMDANGLVPPPGGNLRGDINAMIWTILGVSVTVVEGEELKKAGMPRGLLVEKVRSDGPTQMLHEGDIIVGVHRWATDSVPTLAWCILQPIARDVAVVEPTTRSTAETVKLHLLRGGAIERIDVELQPWAPGPRPSRSAPSWVGQGNSNAAANANVPVTAGKTTTLLGPSEFRERLIEQEQRLAKWKTEDATKFSGNSEANKKLIEEATQRTERELNFLREEYAAQLRLLELEVQDAAAAVAAAQQMQKIAHEQEGVARGKMTQGNLLASERAVQEANLRFQRAKTLLELYRKADPKDAAAEASAAPVESKPQ